MATYNLGNVVGLVKDLNPPSAKPYVLWGKILNAGQPDIVELRYFNGGDPTKDTDWLPLAATKPKVITITGTSYTLQADDDGQMIITTNASPVTINVPASLSAGFACVIWQKGAGAVTPVGTGGMAVLNRNNNLTTAGINAGFTINVTVVNEANVQGDLV